MKDIIPEQAVEALFKANKFFRNGNDVFKRGITSTLLKNAGQDGLIIGKDAKAMQNVFKQVAGQDNVMSEKAIFREIDALTGKSVPKADGFDALKPMLDDKGKALLTVKQGDELKAESEDTIYLMLWTLH